MDIVNGSSEISVLKRPNQSVDVFFELCVLLRQVLLAVCDRSGRQRCGARLEKAEGLRILQSLLQPKKNVHERGDLLEVRFLYAGGVSDVHDVRICELCDRRGNLNQLCNARDDSDGLGHFLDW